MSDWAELPIGERAALLREGRAFPGETADEARCRLKTALDLLDDADLGALLDCGQDALNRRRVDGTGPTPVRIARAIYYRRADVLAWLERNRDGVRGTSKKESRS
jgi:hypothetical protein